MPARLPAERRRRQLLRVALEVFAEQGFHATSMDDVALTAGVTKPVLYQHFPSKRALYAELLEDVERDITGRITAAAARAGSGRERVELGFAAYFDFVAAHGSAFRLLFGASVRNDRQFAAIAQRTIDGIAELVATMIEIDVPADHRLALAHAVVGMAEATSRRMAGAGAGAGAGGDAGAAGQAEAAVEPARLARWLAEMAWFGLRGVRADEPAGRATR